MSNAALAVVEQNQPIIMQASLSREQIDTIKRTICREASDPELQFFVEICNQTRLNPFLRQIYFVKNKPPIVSIDGYRALAERTGKYRGQLGPYWLMPDGQTWTDVWVAREAPQAAKISVLRADFDQPITRSARLLSYTTGKDNWVKMPEVMIAKCAEALALRAAFPDQLGGIYTEEEMQQAGVKIEHGEAVSQVYTPPEREQRNITLNSVPTSAQSDFTEVQTAPEAEQSTVAPGNLRTRLLIRVKLSDGYVKSPFPERGSAFSWRATDTDTGACERIWCWDEQKPVQATGSSYPEDFTGSVYVRLERKVHPRAEKGFNEVLDIFPVPENLPPAETAEATSGPVDEADIELGPPIDMSDAPTGHHYREHSGQQTLAHNH